MPGERGPVYYDGKEISDIHDLIRNFKLDNYEEAKLKRENAEKRNKDDMLDPSEMMPTANDVDKDYFNLI